MQFSAECIILALPFECNFQKKNYILRKVALWGETPLTPIHSALDRERPRMDTDVLLQPVQKQTGSNQPVPILFN